MTPISFKNVLYVPGVKKRLLSIPQITDKGGEVTFKKNEVELKFSGRSYKFGKRDGKLYKLNNMSNDSVDRKKRTSDFKWEKKRVGVKSSVQNKRHIISSSGSVENNASTCDVSYVAVSVTSNKS